MKYYDAKQESKHIIRVDANNFYGYVMSKFLQTNYFRWIYPKEFDLSKYTNNSLKGCLLEFDLVQELRNDYQLAPYKIGTQKIVVRLRLLMFIISQLTMFKN